MRFTKDDLLLIDMELGGAKVVVDTALFGATHLSGNLRLWFLLPNWSIDRGRHFV